ncbi:hypothetical protein FSP39_001373 [Pinctada imbricata]|uniref:Protein FAM207A n=1 Tax=Pinctada imbricata TaxID=66713 RepID=A0AA88XKF3_PINIB|nr:hypothetical protein FSP39_001373 [Pinctada imbricata]
MGKQKRSRSKAHISAVKPNGKKNDKDVDNNKVDIVDSMDTDAKVQTMADFVNRSDNIFSDVKIDPQALAKKLPDFDARSAITSKSLKELKLKKKDKKKLRHDLWIKKLSAIDAAKKEAKEKKRRQQTPVVGDIGAMGDALPTLDLLMMGDKKKKLDDIALFHQVRAHPAFKENPTSTIKEHLENKLKQDDSMET